MPRYTVSLIQKGIPELHHTGYAVEVGARLCSVVYNFMCAWGLSTRIPNTRQFYEFKQPLVLVTDDSANFQASPAGTR